MTASIQLNSKFMRKIYDTSILTIDIKRVLDVVQLFTMIVCLGLKGILDLITNIEILW